MTTKNLSRTVIEGGRHNTRERYESNRKYRAQNRAFTQKATRLVDPDDAEAAPLRRPVDPERSDKLSPTRRWLETKVGMRWSRVFSELTRKFDTRTIAGRHVVYDHILRDIVMNMSDWRHFSEGMTFSSYVSYYLDENRVLCKVLIKSTRPHYSSRKDVHKWAAGRRIANYGTSLFWMVPTKLEWVICGCADLNGRWINSYSCGKEHIERLALTPAGDPSKLLAIDKAKMHKEETVANGKSVTVYFRQRKVRMCLQNLGQYVQGPRLSPEDVTMLFSISAPTRMSLYHVVPNEKGKIVKPERSGEIRPWR